MRKVTFLICLFILFPVTLSAQPPKPRRATGAGVISTPYLKWVSFTREFGIKGDLLGLDNSLRFSPDGRTIFIAGANGPVLLPTPYPNTQINLRTTKSVKEVLQKGKITNYYLSPDLQRIFISKPNGGSEVWNPHNAKRIGDIERIFLLSFSPDGQMLSTIDYGSERVEVWNSHNARISTTISISALSATPFSSSHTTFSPDRKMLAVVGRRNVNSKLQEFIIDILNPHNGKRIRTITVPKRGLKVKMNTPIVFSPDGQALVVGIELMKQAYKFRTFEEQHEQKTKYTQDSLEFLNPHNGRHIRSVELPKEYSGAQSLVFSPDGQILAGAMTEKLGAMTNTIFLWDPHTGEHLRTLQTENLVKSVVFSPNGQILAPSSGKDTIPLWNPHTGEVTRTLKHYVTFDDFKTLPGVEFPAAAKGEVSGLDIIDFTFNPEWTDSCRDSGVLPCILGNLYRTRCRQHRRGERNGIPPAIEKPRERWGRQVGEPGGNDSGG